MDPVLTNSIDLVFPHAIPSESSIAEWILHHPSCQEIGRNQNGHGAAVTNFAMAQALERVLANLPPAGKVVESLGGQPDDLAHDAYFHVRRVENDESAVFVRGVLSARLVFLNDVAEDAVSISRNELEAIERAFADLLNCLHGGAVNSASYVTDWRLSNQRPQAKKRWVRGHLMFAMLTQGLIVSFRALGHGLRAGNLNEVRRWADLSISLLNGSAGAFTFTGDFPPEEYEDVIRPSMTPPISPIGLSGLMSADHRFMAQIMRDMRPALKSLAEQEPERHDRIAAAVSAVYDSHIHVCERFVGPRPSILTAGRTERSGPSLIEQFKTLRLKPFEHPQRALRLTADRQQAALGECPFQK